MSEIVVSEKHKKAVALNQKIVTSAELAQQNLWDMCVSLKTMRDDKLYKELGYGNFEDYCENEAGFSRMNAYRYITIAEKINPENVTPVLQIGIKKLSLLATLSGEQQKKVIENVDTDTVTYRELKAEIDKQIINAYCKSSNLDELFYRLADIGLQSVDTADKVLMAYGYIDSEDAKKISLEVINYGAK